MSRHSGRFGAIYISGVKVVSVKAFKLSLKRKRSDATCMGDTNEVTVQGLPAVSGSWSGYWDDSDSGPWVAQAATTAPYAYLYFDETNNPEWYAYGPIWMDLELDTAVDKAVEISGDISAAGSWTIVYATGA